MEKITVGELRTIAETTGLRPCRVTGTQIVNIRKNTNNRFEDISWEEFESVLSQRGLAVYKASGSDCIKIMRDKTAITA